MEVLKREPAALLTSKLDWYWRNDKGQACTSRVAADIHDKINAPNRAESEQAEGNPPKSLSIPELEEECQILESFVRTKQDASLPPFELKDQHPFNNQHLYWSKLQEDGESGDTVNAIK